VKFSGAWYQRVSVGTASSDFLIRTCQEAELLESSMALVVEAASRRLDFEQSRDGSATGSKKPDHVPIDFPTGSGSLKLDAVTST